MAAKHYVNYTGAALRIRRVNKGRGNFEGKIRENRFKKCAQILQHQVSNLKKFFTKHNFRSLETVKDIYLTLVAKISVYPGLYIALTILLIV